MKGHNDYMDPSLHEPAISDEEEAVIDILELAEVDSAVSDKVAAIVRQLAIKASHAEGLAESAAQPETPATDTPWKIKPWKRAPELVDVHAADGRMLLNAIPKPLAERIVAAILPESRR